MANTANNYLQWYSTWGSITLHRDGRSSEHCLVSQWVRNNHGNQCLERPGMPTTLWYTVQSCTMKEQSHSNAKSTHKAQQWTYQETIWIGCIRKKKKFYLEDLKGTTKHRWNKILQNSLPCYKPRPIRTHCSISSQ